jgi:hypothetical protein
MRRTTAALLALGLGWLALAAPDARGADGDAPAAGVDLHALYQRLQPGMSVAQVAAAAGRLRLGPDGEPVTSWLLWSRSADGRDTVVLRAAFRDARLARVEYEIFGETYRRQVRGEEPATEISAPELHRLRQRTRAVEEAVGDCESVLEAYHRLLVRAQERLTTMEQLDWARALEQRRALQRELGRVGR